MKVLVMGGFGTVGVATVEECLRRGHSISVFEVPHRHTERLARRYGRRGVRVFPGDVRNISDLLPAAAGQDAVIHLAAVLPPASEKNPELCAAVNVGGTENLLSAMKSTGGRVASIVLVSSASVMGPPQKRVPPVHPGDPLAPTDTYSQTKVEAEKLVSSSGVPYCILRLAAVMPTRAIRWTSLNMATLIFDMPLEARCEIVLDIDVAFALAEAADNLVSSGTMAGERAFIAGGESTGCQVRTRDLVSRLFRSLGLTLPDKSLFPPDPDSYYLDWYHTEEAQDILRYQRHTFDDWQAIMMKNLRLVRPLLTLFRPQVTGFIERRSPRFRPSARP